MGKHFVAVTTRSTLDDIARQLLESFCRVDALASLNSSAHLSRARQQHFPQKPTITLPELVASLRSIKVVIPRRPLYGHREAEFIFDQCFLGGETLQCKAKDFKESFFTDAMQIGSAGLIDGQCFGKDEDLIWIPDTPLRKLIRIENAKADDDKAKKYKGPFACLRDYVKSSRESGLKEISVDPPPTPALLSYKARLDNNQDFLDPLFESKPVLHRCIDVLVDPSRPRSSDPELVTPTVIVTVLDLIKKSPRLAEALLEVKDSNHSELYSSMIDHLTVTSEEGDKSLRTSDNTYNTLMEALETILPENPSYACSLFKLYNDTGHHMIAARIAARIADQVAKEIKREGTQPGDNLDTFMSFFKSLSDWETIILANGMLWVAQASINVAGLAIKHYNELKETGPSTTADLVREFLAERKYKEVIGWGIELARSSREEPSESYLSRYEQYIQIAPLTGKSQIEIETYQEINRFLCSVSESAPTNAPMYYKEGFTYEVAPYMLRFHTLNPKEKVRLGRVVDLSKCGVLLVTANDTSVILTLISEATSIETWEKDLDSTTANLKLAGDEEILFPKLVRSIYNELFKSLSDEDRKRQSWCPGLFAGSALLAFVLFDYMDRERKIDFEVEKLRTLYQRRLKDGNSGENANNPLPTNWPFFKFRDEPGNSNESSYSVIKKFIIMNMQGTFQRGIQNQHSYKDEITGHVPASFFGLSLDRNAETIKNMDDLVCNIEALLVHDTILAYFIDPGLKALANCFNRIDDDSFAILQNQVHSLPKGEVKFEEVYKVAHKHVLQSKDLGARFKNALRENDIYLVQAMNQVFNFETTQMQSNVEEAKKMFIKPLVSLYSPLGFPN